MVRGLLLLGMALGFVFPALAACADRDDQREAFKSAHDRIVSGARVDMDALRERFADYPLLAYLEAAYLLRDPAQRDHDAILAFLDDHGDLPLERRVRGRWLHELADRGEWAAFASLHRGGGSATLRCHGLRARKETAGVDAEWLSDARALWLVGYSQPRACDPVFAELYARDALTRDQRWERITRILANGDTGLARALRQRLHPEDRDWLDHWLTVRRDPARYLDAIPFEPDARRARQILRDGIRQLARRDREVADARLADLHDRGALPAEQTLELRRHIALRAAYSRADDALGRLFALPDEAVDTTVREWRARVAVGRQHWPKVLESIAALPEAEQGEPRWRYWRARALVAGGDREAAGAILEPLAEQRHYYGFLAADALGRPYAMEQDEPEVDRAGQAALARRPGMERARELRAVGMQPEARREWRATLADADSHTLGQAAQLALEWGWYDRAIQAANRGGFHNALNLRFPTGFRDTLEDAAREAGVDPSLVFSVARKESTFSPDARSSAGALGLLQVLPETARSVASRVGERAPASSGLLDPATNARLGAHYLAEVLARYDGNLVLAAAAYNAGPSRADDWLERHPGQPADVWIENITFGETRDYVKSLLAFRAVFDWQRTGEVRPLALAMPRMPGGLDDAEFAFRVTDDGDH